MHTESPWPQRRRVDHSDVVRRTDNDDLAAMLNAVKLGEQLVEHALRRARSLAVNADAPGRDCVQLIEEDDARRGAVGGPEEPPHTFL